MKASSAAEGHKSEIARIVTALDGDDADCFLHRGIHDANHARGKLLDRQLGLVLLEPTTHDVSSAFEVESEVAAEECFRTKTSKQKVCIRDRRLFAAPVTDRTRIGTRGFRTDAQRSGGVEASDRTTAR